MGSGRTETSVNRNKINLVLTLEVLFLLVSFNCAGGSYVNPPSSKNNVWVSGKDIYSFV